MTDLGGAGFVLAAVLALCLLWSLTRRPDGNSPRSTPDRPHSTPVGLRNVVIDMAEEGYTYAQIVEGTGLSRATVGRILKRNREDERRRELEQMDPIARQLYEQSELMLATQWAESFYRGWGATRRKMGLGSGRADGGAPEGESTQTALGGSSTRPRRRRRRQSQRFG